MRLLNRYFFEVVTSLFCLTPLPPCQTLSLFCLTPSPLGRCHTFWMAPREYTDNWYSNGYSILALHKENRYLEELKLFCYSCDCWRLCGGLFYLGGFQLLRFSSITGIWCGVQVCRLSWFAKLCVFSTLFLTFWSTVYYNCRSAKKTQFVHSLLRLVVFARLVNIVPMPIKD